MSTKYMNNIQKRFLLFLVGCIGIRSLFVIVAKNSPVNYLKYLGFLALLPAVGFVYIFLTGTRQTGAEVFGEKIWWNNLRPIHAFLYFLFAYNAIMGKTNAWIYLLIDVILGLLGFIIFHYKNGDFAKLIK
ncbi:MAG: hypothetical protein MUP82_06450 [Candidatus Marinimicrobia bacterium]|nr:hypothetical protein [Candidatus Neomarinimicrobiota bacterium]